MKMNIVKTAVQFDNYRTPSLFYKSARQGMRAGDVWVLHNYFGMQVPSRDWLATARGRGVTVVEDHSHDPLGSFAHDSQADYGFAVLRKTLPLPDGGVLWSPLGLPLPEGGAPAPSPLTRIAAMLGKAAYLRGAPFPKALYREWFAEAETHLGQVWGAGVSAYSRERLGQLDIVAWISARAHNLEWLRAHVESGELFSMLEGPHVEDDMGLVLHFAEAPTRDAFRQYLTSCKVYSAVLWPLPVGVTPAEFLRATAFQARMLFLPADSRYLREDLMHLRDVIDQFKRVP